MVHITRVINNTREQKLLDTLWRIAEKVLLLKQHWKEKNTDKRPHKQNTLQHFLWKMHVFLLCFFRKYQKWIERIQIWTKWLKLLKDIYRWFTFCNMLPGKIDRKNFCYLCQNVNPVRLGVHFLWQTLAHSNAWNVSYTC